MTGVPPGLPASGTPLVEVSGASFASTAPVGSSRACPSRRGPASWWRLVGPNGAGKSTLVRLVAGLLAASGTVRLGGLDPHAAPRRAVARLCALVPQEPRTPWPFTVREAVMIGRAPRQSLLARAGPLDHGAVDGALRACDLVHLRRTRLDALSGGERRRVFFARALAQEPRVPPPRRPTAFLDLAHQVAVMELTQVAAGAACAWWRSCTTSTLAAASCSRLVVLSNGRVVAEGAPAAVLTAERVREVWGVRVWRGRTAPPGPRSVLPAPAASSR